jgi:ABC-type transport system involved in multi-copper enzyme maturation permease subunit
VSPTTTITPYRSTARDARDGFGRLLHAEWTKFRTVRGWVIGMIVAVLVTGGLGVLVAEASANVTCQASNGPARHGAACGSGDHRLLGPGGEPVQDQFYFVRQPLAGNGTLTVQVTSLTEALQPSGPRGQGYRRPGLVPWAKAGIIISDGTSHGSAYAAMMVTGGNGVRMQWNYTGDTPGLPGAVSAAGPRWLRLTRDGGTITGYDSADGTHWTRVGTVQLAGLPSTVQAGLFATSPEKTTFAPAVGVGGTGSGPSEATAVFDHVSRTGTWPASAWTGDFIGGGAFGNNQGLGGLGGYHQAAGRFTVTGSGDIAPVVAGPAGIGTGNFSSYTIEVYLIGTFAGLVAVAVVATMFMTAEYRRGLIRTTLAASRGRGRVLAAKAAVIGSAAFVTGLAAAAAAVFAATDIAHSKGFAVFPEPWPTELRIIVGTAALVAVAAVFTLAVATIVRRGAAAILIVIVAVVVPFFLAVTSAVPLGVANWLLRITPAAAFALQQATPRYYQVQAPYMPSTGFYPLLPWAGFAVLCGWTALALAGAVYLLRRRDA